IASEPISADSSRSTRPVPPRDFASQQTFPFKRGDSIYYAPVPTVARRPHIEDQQCNGLQPSDRSLGEDELAECLRKAEFSSTLEHLFGCQPQSSSVGGRAVWVNPQEARRSICGCEDDNIRFRLFAE